MDCSIASAISYIRRTASGEIIHFEFDKIMKKKSNVLLAFVFAAFALFSFAATVLLKGGLV